MAIARVLTVGFALVAASLAGDASVAAASVAPRGGPVPGYWLAGADGGVFAFNAPFEGSGAPASGSPGECPFVFGPTINVSTGSLAGSGQVISNSNCVGIAGSEAGSGYWVANFSSLPRAFGSASALGQLGCSSLNGATVGWSGITATPDGRGFFLASVNGGVLTCGNATALGGVTNLHLAAPIVGIASTPDGKGYWLVGGDGGVFAFGDAGYFGSMGNKSLNAPIVGIASAPDGKGYWLVGADGGVFSFGDATFDGSMAGRSLNRPIAGMAANPDGSGYWLVGADGGVFAFGGAPFQGSMVGSRLNAPICGYRGCAELSPGRVGGRGNGRRAQSGDANGWQLSGADVPKQEYRPGAPTLRPRLPLSGRSSWVPSPSR